MKTLLIINGSYREAGDMVYLIDNFVKGFKESAPDANIEIII
jgi:hypothetical protein